MAEHLRPEELEVFSGTTGLTEDVFNAVRRRAEADPGTWTVGQIMAVSPSQAAGYQLHHRPSDTVYSFMQGPDRQWYRFGDPGQDG